MKTNLSLFALISVLGTIGASCPDVVSRQRWRATEGGDRGSNAVTRPASYVIVHHTSTPKCITRPNCEKMVRSLQNVDMKYNGRDDIGYNFLIGEDGNVYEGVGWNRAATNLPSYDRRSIHVAIMGDYTSWLPDAKVLTAMKNLIECGTSKGFIYSDYVLIGHRQLESKDCPGRKLNQEIEKWPHWNYY